MFYNSTIPKKSGTVFRIAVLFLQGAMDRAEIRLMGSPHNGGKPSAALRVAAQTDDTIST